MKTNTASAVASREVSRGFDGARQPLSSDLMEVLRQIEDRFPVLSWRASGIEIWPLVRLRWFFGEWAAHYTSGQPAARRFSAQLRRIAEGAVRRTLTNASNAKRSNYRREQCDLIFLSDGLSFANVDGKFVERFCDPLIALAEREGFASDLWTPLHLYHSPRFTPTRFVQRGVDWANIIGVARARISGTVHVPAHAEVLELLTALGYSTTALSVENIRSGGARVREVTSFYENRLTVARPRMAFIVSYYSLEGMAFVQACRKGGIPVVDIQHGVQSDLHPAYAGWPRPRNGDLYDLLPDRFWVWSDWESGVIERWSHGTGHAPVVGGNPWMEVWKDDSGWAGVDQLRKQARAMRTGASGKAVVLVTLQFGIRYEDQISPLMHLMRTTCDQLVFWVRLHPAMLDLRDEVRRYLMELPTVELDECTDLPLQAILPCVDVHVTHSSSTVIEAAQFGVRSVLTTGYGAELFGPLIDAGWAIEAEAFGSVELATVVLELAVAGKRESLRPSSSTAAAALHKLLAQECVKDRRRRDHDH